MKQEIKAIESAIAEYLRDVSVRVTCRLPEEEQREENQ